jgi:hypothetical protein
MKLVYKATGKPVEIGDRVDIRNCTNVVAYFRQPHKPDSEGKVTLRMPGEGEPLGREYYVSVIGAEWIEREDRPWSFYNKAGHVCPKTGRIAMTVADAYARDDSPDRHFWQWDSEADYAGLDPWREIDGIDATMNAADRMYSLDFASGRSASVAADAIVYMQRTKAEREAQ